MDDCKVFGNGINQMWENGEQTYSNNTCILENNSSKSVYINNEINDNNDNLNQSNDSYNDNIL